MLIHKKKANKSVHYRLINLNTLSALDEMPAFTNFNIISNVNITEGTQLLFDRLIIINIRQTSPMIIINISYNDIKSLFFGPVTSVDVE